MGIVTHILWCCEDSMWYNITTDANAINSFFFLSFSFIFLFRGLNSRPCTHHAGTYATKLHLQSKFCKFFDSPSMKMWNPILWKWGADVTGSISILEEVMYSGPLNSKLLDSKEVAFPWSPCSKEAPRHRERPCESLEQNPYKGWFYTTMDS